MTPSLPRPPRVLAVEYSQWIESFNGRFKEEKLSLLLETQTMGKLIEVVNERIRYYNEERRHSSTGYVSPLTFIQQARSDRSTPFLTDTVQVMPTDIFVYLPLVLRTYSP